MEWLTTFTKKVHVIQNWNYFFFICSIRLNMVIPVTDWAITSVCFQLIVDEASITEGTEKVVIATERYHQDGARNDIYMYIHVWGCVCMYVHVCTVFMLIKCMIKLAQEIRVLGFFIVYLNGAHDDLYQKIAQNLKS